VGNGLYSLKIGKDSANLNADGASYNVHVPPVGAFSIIYRYAIVMENPAFHASYEMPRFSLDVVDSTTGIPVPCNTFSFVSTGGLPGFTLSPKSPFDVLYKPWTAGSIDLTGKAGATIIITFKAGGCTRTGHFGYGYVDMNCGLFKIAVVACKASRAVLSAPPGYQYYTWTDSLTFTAAYGSTQTVTITVPSVATTYAVILTPYSGYGCIDTLYAKLLPSNLATHQSPDTTICFGSSVRIWGGATDILPLTYSWTPTTGLSCTTCDTTVATPPVGVNLYQITTTDAGGCLQTDTITVTVQAVAGPIKGNKNVCIGQTSVLSDTVALGVWTSSNTNATIGSSSGIVTGNAMGTATITYSFGLACTQAYCVVTVQPLPIAISGTASVCVGLTTTLSDATPLGTWSSTATVLSIGSSSGVVSGIATGTGMVTYTISTTGCFATKIVTVNPNPGAPTGVAFVCAGSSNTLTGIGGGTWMSGNTMVATIGTTGTYTGIVPGTATITYTLATGCISTIVVTVNLTPVPISGVPSVCVGSTVCLSDATPGGVWSSSATTVATVGSTGCVTGLVATIATISYTLAGGCQATVVVTVQPLPSITGILTVCVGSTTLLTGVPTGGTWASLSPLIASVGSTSGLVLGGGAGTSTIVYTLGTGCVSTAVVTVNPNPPTPLGSPNVCVGGTTCLTDAITGGTWFSQNPAIASVTLIGGCVNGIAGGVDSITYTLASGCYSELNVTVNPTPPSITGPTAVCVGSTISLTDASVGGIWTSSTTNVAVGSATGVVTGMVAGGTTVTYTLPTGCYTTMAITVSPLPTAIIGPTTVCVGATMLLSDATAGGNWSVSNTNASIGGFSGVVTGITAGTDIVTYTVFSTGCFITSTITISAAPGSIGGKLTICLGSTTTLSDIVSGGTWTASNTNVNIPVFTSGVITGVALGTSIISYSLGGSCKVGAVVTVIPLPSGISGTPTVCVGSTTALTDAGGGTWATSNTNASVGPTGVVTGLVAGTSTIIYTVASGCTATLVVTVNPLPTAILGTLSVCVGSSTTLTDATVGGTWSSPSGTVSVNSASGLVTGLSAGPAVIGYKLTTTGCAIMSPFTVNPLPLPITGVAMVCVGLTTALTDAGAGTWTTAATVASVTGTGVVNGILPGTASITYTLGTGCVANKIVTVNPLPGPITGPTALCIGSTGALSDAGGGTWLSSNSTIVAVDMITGIATGGSTLSCATITYTLPVTGCITTTTICVSPSPTAIFGPSAVCVNSTITLSDGIPGGVWTSVLPAIGTIDAFGNFTGKSIGVDTVKYSLGSGCTVSKPVTVNALPAAITGAGTICIGQSLTLSDASLGGLWTTTSTAVTVGSSSGLVSGVGVGVATVTYTLGCIVTTTVTVSATPAAITGPSAVCEGSTITLSDAITGGAWTSSTTAASVGGSTGIVSGLAGGTSSITYSLGGACTVNKTVTVYPIGPITGAATMCVGVTLTLSDLVPTVGSIWTSGTTSVATVDPVSGLVTAKGMGTTTIVYTTPAGCTAATTINVSATPSAIVGPNNVCVGDDIFLSDAVTGGTWTAPAYLSIVSVGPLPGQVHGIAAGTAIITYSLGGSCVANKTITVNPAFPITGSPNLCTGLTTALTDKVTGGTWTSSNTFSAIVGYTTGIVTGMALPGTATITYTSPFGCVATLMVTVNSVPGPITGVKQVCQGLTTALTDATLGGTWASVPAIVAPVGLSTGIVTGAIPGTAIITYSLGSGCSITTVVTVEPLPAAISAPGNLCPGTTIICSDATAGGTWSVSNTNASITIGGVVTGLVAGTTTVTYSLLTGCIATKVLTINPTPPAIGGTATVCVGQTTTLTETGTGTWSSSGAAISVGPTTGIVSGLAPGVGVVTWNATSGCKATLTVTVVPKPTPILGSTNICVGGSTTLTDGSPGGAWVSADTSVATIDPVSGLVNGLASGTVLISYTAGFGCMVFAPVVVSPISPITGPSTVCIGQSINLFDTTLGGTWSSLSGRVSVGPGTGIVTGVSGGTAIITYKLATGCTANDTVTVAPAIPAITGKGQVCIGSVIALSDTRLGGIWSSSNANATVLSGIVTGVAVGPVYISYTLGGCAVTHLVNVNPLPAAITGNPNVCIGQTTALSDAGFGTWLSTLPGNASVGLTSGIVTGILAGTTIISYTLPGTGCVSTVNVTINPLPSSITGITTVCVGQTTALTDAGGGTWISSDISIAQVGTSSGIVTGIAKGTATITYTIGTGCSVTTTVKVNNIPTFIIGSPEICQGSTETLSDATSGGTWTSDFPAYATVDITTGLVTGVAPGITTISYSLGTGCATSMNLLVDPLPAPITGNTTICVSTFTTLADASSPLGTWSSTNTAIAAMFDPFGDVVGVSPGTATISYTLATGCASTALVTVYPAPTTIYGTSNVCIGSSYVFSDGVTGGTWTSTNTTVATAGYRTGVVTGLSLGASIISYQLAPGCAVALPINVVPLPSVFTVTESGTGHYCSGGTGVDIGLNGSAVGANYFLYVGGVVATGPLAGTGLPLDFGMQTVGGIYSVIAVNAGTGCSVKMSGTPAIVVDPTVTPSISISTGLGDTVCSGTLVMFTATGTNTGTLPVWKWNVNGVYVSLTSTYSYVPANGDIVTVTLTSNALCATPVTVSKSEKMTVATPQMPSVKITADPGDTICQGKTVTITAAPAYGGTAPTYAWIRNTSLAGTGPVFTYLAKNGDVVYCNMTSNFPCVVTKTVASNSIVMVVDAPLIPHVTIAGHANIGIGWTDTLTAVVSNGGVSPTYQWVKNGIPVVGQTTARFISNKFQTGDSVACEVTSSGLCEMTTHAWIYLNVSAEGVTPLPQGAGELSVLPNPNKGAFTIKGSLGTTNDEEVSLEITNLLGQVVYKNKVLAKNGVVNQDITLSKQLANGMYMLSVHSDEVNKVFHVVVEQ
jgi:uncharacterized protein YjdB